MTMIEWVAGSGIFPQNGLEQNSCCTLLLGGTLNPVIQQSTTADEVKQEKKYLTQFLRSTYILYLYVGKYR